jgi:hypothetical protein
LRSWRLGRMCPPLCGGFQARRHPHRRTFPRPRRRQLVRRRPRRRPRSRRRRTAGRRYLPHAVRSSRRHRPRVIVSSSRSARRATTGCGASRPFSVARSRMVISARSSTARSPSFSKRSRRRNWARQPNPESRPLSVPGRIARPPRHTASYIKRSAWRHDGGQCAFVSKDGRRCTERAFLEFHHVRPYALGGPTTAENISLRCRRHNQYEAELVFGPRTKRAWRATPDDLTQLADPGTAGSRDRDNSWS